MSDYLVLPTRGITFSLDTDADTVECHCCLTELEADWDEEGERLIAQDRCPECDEPTCRACLDSNLFVCAACVADASALSASPARGEGESR